MDGWMDGWMGGYIKEYMQDKLMSRFHRNIFLYIQIKALRK